MDNVSLSHRSRPTLISFIVFANLYYEINNFWLDFEVSEQSNLKCALYGDVHTAAEKTNFGLQQSYPAPAPLIHIQESGGWALRELVEPAVPEGYEKVFGPINFSNSAPNVSSSLPSLHISKMLTFAFSILPPPF